MKTPNVLPPDATTRARKVLDGWIAAGLTNEAIAVRVGCTGRSVENWRCNKRISRLSAAAILNAAEQEAK